MNLGFSNQEIIYGDKIFNENGMWVPKAAQEIMGNNYDDKCDIVKYYVNLRANDLFQDTVKDLGRSQVYDISDVSEGVSLLAQHYKKMHSKFNRGADYRTISNFMPIGLKSMDTLCCCRELLYPFDIYNYDENNILNKANLYKFVKKGVKESIFTTSKMPELKTEKEAKNDQVKITKIDDNNVEVRVRNEYIGLINRFVIDLSFRPPVDHNGCIIIVSSSGNVYYIYAFTMNNSLKLEQKLEYKQGVVSSSQVMLGYGFSRKDLEVKLLQASQYLYKQCDGQVAIIVKPSIEFEEQVLWQKDLDAQEQLENNW